MTALPPTDHPVVFVHDGQNQHGPMTLDQVVETINAGRGAPGINLWWEGAAGWAPASSFPELAARMAPIATSPTPAPAPAPAPAAVATVPPRSPEDVEALEALFAEQIEASWAHFKRIDFHGRLDDVLVGAIITSTLDTGQVLIDLTSGGGLGATGSNHYLRFEDPTTTARTTIALAHLTGDPASAEVLGHHARIEIGWGQRVAEAGQVVSAIKQELQGNLIQTSEPGMVSIDGDVASGYAYTQIDLIWALEDFVSPEYEVDHERLRRHIDAVVHSLQKYWYGRFQPAR